jgi:hypothetical protein
MKNGKVPNYDNLLIKQENITTFIGKPAVKKNNNDTSQGNTESDDLSEKQAFVSVGSRQQKRSSYNGNGFLRKIGEFFK